jgi:mitochondrial import receptor subunit TOM40
MIQFEGDWVGAEGTSVNFKAINPDPTDGNGIFTAALLQSVSKSVAVGGELITQKVADSGSLEHGVNLGVKWRVNEDSTFTATLQQFVALQSSYHHRVSDKVELATEMQLLLVGPRKDAVTSCSAKFDYRQASLRAQLDSTGRVGMFLEEKLFPGFALLLSGEIDHVRAVSRFGLGITMEN